LRISLVLNTIKQNYKAIAFIAIAFFAYRVWGIVDSFNPQMYKLSLGSWVLNLSLGLFKDFVYSNLVLMPVLLVSLIINSFGVIGLSNLISILYRLYFAAAAVIVSIGLYVFWLLKNNELNSKQIKSFSIHEFMDFTNIYSLGVVFIFFLALFFSIKIYKKFFKKRYYDYGFLKSVALTLLVGINIFCVVDLARPILNLNYELKSEVLAKINEIKTSPLIDIHKSFEDYLGLNTQYENKESLLNLLKRKTNQKKKELNVVFIYLKNLSKEDYKKYFSSNMKSYSFNRTLMSSNNTDLAVLSLKSNIPVFKNLLTSLKDKDLKKIKTYYLRPFREYNQTQLDGASLEEVSRSIEESKNKFFIFSSVDSFSEKSIKYFFGKIRKSDNTIFILTGGHKSDRSTDKISLKFLNQSTFLSFYLPKGYSPKYYDKNRVVGQEDLMTTVYNLALSNKDYLTLGDDIFLESNSNAISLELYADQQGAYIDNSFYPWKSSSESKEEDRKFLKQRYEATKSISRYIIFNESGP